MENKKIVVANTKMNMTIEEISKYLEFINENIITKQVVICPTSIYVPYFLKQGYSVGLQNSFMINEGAYTGEVSPMQATSMGINYTIIGHSERRTYFRENEDLISKKILEAVKYNMNVIVCIGESIEEKNMLKTDRVLKRQIMNALRPLEGEMLDNIIIAYEPVWAIGTKQVAENREIEEVINYIKMIVNQYKNYEDIKVIYGGSVNEKNIKSLNRIEGISGFLVGGASIDTEKFIKIVNEVVVNQ